MLGLANQHCLSRPNMSRQHRWASSWFHRIKSYKHRPIWSTFGMPPKSRVQMTPNKGQKRALPLFHQTHVDSTRRQCVSLQELDRISGCWMLLVVNSHPTHAPWLALRTACVFVACFSPLAIHGSGKYPRFSYENLPGWWCNVPILKNVSSSMGRIIYPIYEMENNPNVPNHHPAPFIRDFKLEQAHLFSHKRLQEALISGSGPNGMAMDTILLPRDLLVEYGNCFLDGFGNGSSICICITHRIHGWYIC